MNATYVLEKGISRLSTHEYEEDIARRWWDLPLHVTLPLTNGESGVPPKGPDHSDVNTAHISVSRQ